MQVAPSLHYRPSKAVYRRRRLAVLLCATFVVVGAWFGLHKLTGSSGDGSLSVAGQPVSVNTQLVGHTVAVVQPGDTLWSLARRVLPHDDVRPLVAAMSAQRHGQPLLVGETVELPFSK